MSEPVDDLLLDRYVAGECAPAERAYVDRMLAADPAWALRVEQIRTLRGMTQRLSQPWDVDRLWSAMQVRTAAAGTDDTRRAASARVTMALPRAEGRPRGAVARLAAAVVIVAAGALGVWHATQTPRPVEVPRYHVEAANGRIVSVRLADGTRVTLAAGSVLDAPQSFSDAGRDVRLVGQAYFEVAHDSTRPLRVHTRGALTRVVGTKFSVRAYPDDPDVTVVVTEGRVAFGVDTGARAAGGATPKGATGSARPGVLLARGDRARLEPDGRVRVEHGVAVDNELAWLQGRLVLVDAPLPTVVRELERWYDVRIVIADTSLTRVSVTASFGNDSVDRVLHTLAVSLGVGVKRRGHIAWLGTPR